MVIKTVRTSLEKQLLKNLLFYSGLTVIISILLVIIFIRLNDEPTLINYIFLAFDSLMIGYFGTKSIRFYKKYLQYKKFGVRGTWGV